MKKKIKIIVGMLGLLAVFLTVITIILIIQLAKKPYIGKWYKIDIYDNEEIITTIKIKKNKSLSIEKKLVKKSQKSIINGKWDNDEKNSNLIIITFTINGKKEKNYLFVENKNTICIEKEKCNEKEQLHKKNLFEEKKYKNSYNEKYNDDYESIFSGIRKNDDDIKQDNAKEESEIPQMTVSKQYSFDSDYNSEEDQNKIPIYVFYGQGCPYCEKLFEALDSLDKSIKDIIVVKMYEVWHNEINYEYMSKVEELREENARKVPYVIIGNKSWHGFTQRYLEEMVEEIKQEST